ncbi:hypothetical protein [Stenotrophomonas sp. 1337]|uniref:hypothetical protein n=1 Tax=Stenotrophomonas sp. 1337 TaxID=2817757 RepID=UPI002861CB7F|nr:hypothetical protein [Stenotrophomonas sp. 1337]MDR6695529.1 hypothetical protein [Stenotrophomonas sp. 1337]
MHNESPITPARAEPRVAASASPGQRPGTALYAEQRQRAKRTALWVGAIAVLVYVGFILSGVIGR